MLSIFQLQLKIEHADWPYILQALFVYVFISSLLIFFLDGDALLISLFIFTMFILTLNSFHQYHQQNEELEHQHYKIQAIGEIQNLLTFRAPIPAMNGWAATPELAVTVLKEIIRNKPNTIVELGSGVTTLINGYGLEKYNPKGKMISIDHDSDYAAITNSEIELHGLENVVELRVAPLKKVNINSTAQTWYDSSAFEFKAKIDLLIVDGPPVKTEKYARYPALPVLHEHLSDSCTIIIHDTKRKQESAIVKNWLNEFPSFQESKLRTDKGISVLSR